MEDGAMKGPAYTSSCDSLMYVMDAIHPNIAHAEELLIIKCLNLEKYIERLRIFSDILRVYEKNVYAMGKVH